MPEIPQDAPTVEITPGTRQHDNFTCYLAMWEMLAEFALSVPDDLRAWCILQKIPAFIPADLEHARDFAKTLTAEMIIGGAITIKRATLGEETTAEAVRRIVSVVLDLLRDEDPRPGTPPS